MASLDNYVQRRLAIGKGLKFVKYWGASNKRFVDEYDLNSLLAVFSFLRKVEKDYKVDAHLTLIFTDTHAVLNGFSFDNFNTYVKGIRRVLNLFQYSHVTMSEILRSYLRESDLVGLDGLVDSIVVKSSSEVDIQTLADEEPHSFATLILSAAKHCLRLSEQERFAPRHFTSNMQAAYAYVLLNRIERHHVERAFKGCVFLTYASSDETELIAPRVPIVQIFSYRTGIRSRPWFSIKESEAVCAELLQS